MTEQSGHPLAAPDDAERGPLWKYLGIFVATSIGMSALYALFEELFGVNLGGVYVIVPVFAAMVTVDRFVADRRRIPAPDEKWWLIGWSFGVTIAWSLLVALTFWAFGWTAELTGELGGLLALLLLIGAVVTFLLIWLGFAFWPKRSLRNLQRREERQAAKRR